MPFLQVSDTQHLVRRMGELERARHNLQPIAGEALSASKRVIFALHRLDRAGAEREWKSVVSLLEQGRKLVRREPRLAQEGVWRAAREEALEAGLYLAHDKGADVKALLKKEADPDVVVGALSDLVGELVRRAVHLATQHKTAEVGRLQKDASEIVHMLLQMNLTGSLRTKLDQAKGHVRKLEDIAYDLSLKEEVRR